MPYILNLGCIVAGFGGSLMLRCCIGVVEADSRCQLLLLQLLANSVSRVPLEGVIFCFFKYGVHCGSACRTEGGVQGRAPPEYHYFL